MKALSAIPVRFLYLIDNIQKIPYLIVRGVVKAEIKGTLYARELDSHFGREFVPALGIRRRISARMDNAMLDEVAEALERLADQPTWNLDVWQRCHDLVKANWDNELLEYVYDDIIHYDGLFHMRTILGWIFGFRTKPDRCQLEQYRQEFRDIASALRLGLSLKEAKRKYEL